MIFSSLEFIYLFMPPVLIVFFVLRHLKLESAIIWWLITASLAFYAWWSVQHLLLLIGSVVFNFGLHKVLLRYRSKFLLVLGLATNLALLAWFKYADFLIGNLAALAGETIQSFGLILPLAISFFTFQQISFLLDTWSGNIKNTDFKRYVLFVTFFPQLIAGPIVLHNDTVPQFKLDNLTKRAGLNFAIGSTLFAIGLFKKIVLADGIAPFANAVFGAAEAGQSITTGQAWLGTFAYTFQIYFDFSGYCDMALGIARIFGIRLPQNFNSPYKALSISEFWRRWHITLSHFLRNYLYIPLGGNRTGILGQHGNLMMTMLLGGLWHGAGWNFVIWGGLHGSYLVINHAWRGFTQDIMIFARIPNFFKVASSWLITMFVVMIAWVFFRAESFSGAIHILEALIGWQTIYSFDQLYLVDMDYGAFLVAVLVMFVIGLPNSIELMGRYQPIVDQVGSAVKRVQHGIVVEWRPSNAWSAFVFLVFCTGLFQIYRLNDMTEFIYFNF